MPLRNLPETPADLKTLLTVRPGQVSSIEFSLASDPVDITFLAFSEHEGVSATRYPSQTCYYCVEGTMALTYEDRTEVLKEGQIVLVQPQVEHAIGGLDDRAFKVLQINL